MKKKFQCLLCSLLIFVLLGNNVVYAQEGNISVEKMNQILREAQVPEDIISEMDPEEKAFIISTLDPDMKYIEVTEEPQLIPYADGYAISQSDLSLSVTAFKSGDQITIYPTYEWLTPTKPIGKDYFAYSVSSSYSAVPNERRNVIYSKVYSWESWVADGSATYTGSSLYGYEHSGNSLGTPDSSIYLKGTFYYKVDIDSDDPVKKIVLSYVHDTSWGSALSYGVSYGPASISITPSSTNVGYQNNVYALNY